jgi:hypothetical protein
MSLYIKVLTSFYNHRKTAKLRVLIGEAALWLPPRLWAYAAENQPDGDFSSFEPEEIAELIGYKGDAQAMLQALLKAGFMDPDRRLHDWGEHNSYHQDYSERAKKAAKARWDKQKAKGEKKTGEDSIGRPQHEQHFRRTHADAWVFGLVREYRGLLLSPLAFLAAKLK